jgi:hypothetical protein
MREKLIDELVVKYGEKHRVMITDALGWLSEREPVWSVSLNKKEVIQDLVERARN